MNRWHVLGWVFMAVAVIVMLCGIALGGMAIGKSESGYWYAVGYAVLFAAWLVSGFFTVTGALMLNTGRPFYRRRPSPNSV